MHNTVPFLLRTLSIQLCYSRYWNVIPLAAMECFRYTYEFREKSNSFTLYRSMELTICIFFCFRKTLSELAAKNAVRSTSKLNIHMNGKWLTERILNGPFCKNETKQAMLGHAKSDCVDENKIGSKNEAKFKVNLSPKQFLEKYSLPRIVKVTPEEPIAADSCDPSALLNGTLLLYKQYRSGKIEAKKYPSEGSQKEISTIVIPDAYQGKKFSISSLKSPIPYGQVNIITWPRDEILVNLHPIDNNSLIQCINTLVLFVTETNHLKRI